MQYAVPRERKKGAASMDIPNFPGMRCAVAVSVKVTKQDSNQSKRRGMMNDCHKHLWGVRQRLGGQACASALICQMMGCACVCTQHLHMHYVHSREHWWLSRWVGVRPLKQTGLCRCTRVFGWALCSNSRDSAPTSAN